MGAGILPSTIHNGKLYFLFGKEGKYEDSAPGFSDFGGGTDNNESFIETAIREAGEEFTGFLGNDMDIRRISNKIARKATKKSYAPTINDQLVTLNSIDREDLLDCNINSAFKFKEPLQIGIPGTKKCFEYYTQEAQDFLLKNLSADKHINPKKIIPPIQSQSNCWFNAMFATFFISDKGRKFFHFLRQLMIEGKQSDGNAIPEKLRDAFALLNFAKHMFGKRKSAPDKSAPDKFAQVIQDA